MNEKCKTTLQCMILFGTNAIDQKNRNWKKKWKRPTVSHDSVTWLGLLIPSSISLYLKPNKTYRAKQANKMNIHRVNKTTLTVISKYYIIEKGPYANDDLRYIKSSDCLKYKDLCGLLFSLNSIKCWPVHKKKSIEIEKVEL